MAIESNAFIIDSKYVYSSKQEEILDLCDKLGAFYEKRISVSYSPDVENIDICFYCGSFSKGGKRPVYYENKYIKDRDAPCFDITLYHELSIDIDMNDKRDALFNSDLIGGYNIVAQSTIDYIRNVNMPLKIRKTFDKQRFIEDLKEFFVSIGCDEIE